jgi:hypothetical protein
MDTSPLLILLICALVAVTFGAIAFFRSGRSKLRRDRGVPIGFGIDAAQGNPDSSDAVRLHHHHHHHSTTDGGHHHSHGGADSGSSHHGGGSDGGSVGGGHH